MRSVSVPRQPPPSNDPVVKIEDTGSAPATPAPAPPPASKPPTPSVAPTPSNPMAERIAKLTVGSEVAYKQSRPREDGSQWIQCHIISITGEGKARRYEVADPEPDESTGTGAVYKANAAALIPIPPKSDAARGGAGGAGAPAHPGAAEVLKEVPVGKTVLARYPETTTFYRAEVRALRRDKQGGEVYRLSFEDDEQERDVPRRYVLDVQAAGGRI